MCCQSVKMSKKLEKYGTECWHIPWPLCESRSSSGASCRLTESCARAAGGRSSSSDAARSTSRSSGSARWAAGRSVLRSALCSVGRSVFRAVARSPGRSGSRSPALARRWKLADVLSNTSESGSTSISLFCRKAFLLFYCQVPV